jgi:hypothetical protein
VLRLADVAERALYADQPAGAARPAATGPVCRAADAALPARVFRAARRSSPGAEFSYDRTS